jgi:hypothetical protein
VTLSERVHGYKEAAGPVYQAGSKLFCDEAKDRAGLPTPSPLR